MTQLHQPVEWAKCKPRRKYNWIAVGLMGLMIVGSPIAAYRVRTLSRKPQHLILSNEAGFRRQSPTWEVVERTISELDTGSGNSFCCLEAPDYGYVQVLHGTNGYHLEWRVFGHRRPRRDVHYRASYPGGSTEPVPLGKKDAFNPGQQRDLLQVEEVTSTFRVFYSGGSLPRALSWRQIDK